MNIKKIKNYFIIFLCITTVYLTGQLWFEKFSNHNFFYTVLNFFSVDQEKNLYEEYAFVEPFRIITGFGNETYTAVYNEIPESPQGQLSNQALKLILQEGKFVEMGEINWEDILSNKFYMLDYRFLVPAEFLSDAYGLKSDDIVEKVGDFTSIIIVPMDSHEGILDVYFIDETENLYHKYQMKSNTLNKAILDEITSQEGKDSNLFYISSEQIGLDIFAENMFIPEWTGSGYEYHPIISENPYAPDGSPLMDKIEPKLNMFFENPEKINSKAANVYTFSDETTVVKYYPENVLEYIYYLPDNYEDPNTSILNSYYIAWDFIKKDEWLTNRYYLDDYLVLENGYTFYFNYTINNFPIKFSESFEIAGTTNMSHPLEITVEKGNVTNYKKSVYNFYVSEEETITTDSDFWDAYDSFIENNEAVKNQKINDVWLGYIGNPNEDSLLYWFIEISDKWFVEET